MFFLINHQLIGKAVQCPRNIPTCSVSERLNRFWYSQRGSYLHHPQYVTVVISNLHSNIAISNIAINPNKPTSKRLERENLLLPRDRWSSVHDWPEIGAMEKYWEKMPN
jgi:hypothetical protein